MSAAPRIERPPERISDRDWICVQVDERALRRARALIEAATAAGRTPAHLVASLQERVDELEEHVRQAFDVGAFDPIAHERLRTEWRLTPLELTMVEAFAIGRSGQTIRKAAFWDAAYADRPEGEQAELKIVDVVMCKVRRKAGTRLRIETVWGEGYRLHPDDHAWLRGRPAPEPGPEPTEDTTP